MLLDGGRLTGEHYKKVILCPHLYIAWKPTQRAVCSVRRYLGPHVAIIPIKGIDEAIEVHNDTDYDLSCAVIIEDFRKARRIRDDCEYGLVMNLPTIGAEVHCPLAVSKSGTGLPSASTLIDVVTHRTAWTVNHAMEIKMAQGLTVQF